MGYESRLYIVKENKKFSYGEVIAIFNCSNMGYDNGWRELFDTPFESEIYAEDGNTKVKKDKYGEKLKAANFSSVIAWLEKEVETDTGRRIKPLLSFLKGFDLSQWRDGEMKIVHFGY